MHARRSATPSPELPSSPPSAPVQEGERSRPSTRERPQSPAHGSWGAASPTSTLAHSSPELPPLPSLPGLGGPPRTPPAAHRRDAANGSYFTASWGSPYQRPPPGIEHEATALKFTWAPSSEIDGEDEAEDPPQFGLDHLLPSRFPADLLPSPTSWDTTALSQLLERTPRPHNFAQNGHSPQSPTQASSRDWIRQLLEGHRDSERIAWWSDDSGSDSADHRQSDPAVVPPDQKQQSLSPQTRKNRKSHKSRQSNLTLKPEDFLALLREKAKQNPEMFASKYADDPPESSTVETKQEDKPVASPAPANLPLPAPSPVMEKPAQAPSPQPPAADSPTPQAPKREEVSSLTPPARTKKTVKCKGKNCVILIPYDAQRGKEGGPPMPLTKADVDARLEKFTRDGYDVRGFQPGPDTTDDSCDNVLQAQNRAIYPDMADFATPDAKRQCRIKIPDRREWEAYVNYLTEQKLRALGVSLGEDEPQDQSPAQMSRRSSQQYPALPFSPPPPPSSTGSHHRNQTGSSAFSSSMQGPSPAFGHRSSSSVASPMSALSNPRANVHMHRNSVFGSLPGFPQQPTPPGFSGFSPQQLVSPHGFARGGSPSMSNIRSDVGDAMSPGSPFGLQHAHQFPFGQRDDLMNQLQQQQRQLQLQALQQQQQTPGNRPTSTLAGVPEDEAEEESAPQLPPRRTTNVDADIAVPSPRGHHHNISQNLEREVRDSEDYHLEKAIDRQLDEDGDFNTESRFTDQNRFAQANGHANPSMDGSHWHQQKPAEHVLHQPQPHNRAHSITTQQGSHGMSYALPDSDPVRGDLSESAKTNASDVETNPSDQGRNAMGYLGQSKHAFSFPQNTRWDDPAPRVAAEPPASQHSAVASHDSKASATKFNAAAKEFKFNPTASFNPTSFNFNAPAFQPGQRSKPSTAPFSRDLDPGSGLPRSTPGHNATGGFNVSAPSFQPGTFGQPASIASEFSFSSNAPSFKPEAPPFQPSKATDPRDVEENSGTASESGNKIFGNVNFQDIVKPAKKSQAVPIVRPDPLQQNGDPYHQEDSDGRITRDDSRQKRSRRFGDDGDDVPQFAVPTHPLTETSRYQTAKKGFGLPDAVAHGKENLSPERELERKPSSQTRERPRSTSKREPLPAVMDGSPGISPISAHEHELSNKPGSLATEPNETAVSPAEESDKVQTHKKNKSSLSATARPFEFKPSDTSVNLGARISTRDANEGTRWPRDQPDQIDHPPTPPGRNLGIPQLTSDDGTFKTAPDSVSNRTVGDPDSVILEPFNDPSFNEIDAVMKHMNQEGSDFGVERDQSSWPDLDPHDRGQSPRRMFASAVQGDTTWVDQDPFDDERAAAAYESPVHRLNDAGDVAISDWDSMVSSTQEGRFHERSRFFNGHVDRLIAGTLQARLDPLEKSLQFIQDSLEGISGSGSRLPRRSRSTENVDSDADDEDDETAVELSYRNRSPRRDRKMEKIRSIIADALSAHQQHLSAPPPSAPADDIRDIIREALASHAPEAPVPSVQAEDIRSIVDEALGARMLRLPPPPDSDEPAAASRNVNAEDFYTALADLKVSVARSTSSNVQLDDIKDIIETTIREQQSRSPPQSLESPKNEANSVRVAELEKALRDANGRIDEEMQSRRMMEDREADTQRSLRLADEELRLLQDTARDDAQKLRSLEEESHITRMNIAVAESASEELRKKNMDLNDESAALQATLDEYRVSHKQWREDIDYAYREKEDLKRAIHQLRSQAEDTIRVRESMRGKLDRLQHDMSSAAAQVADQRAGWHRRDEEHRKRYEVLSARIEAEARTRERLEKELDRLEHQEREFMRMRVTLEQTQHHNDRLEQTVARLRQECTEHQRHADRYEREFREAREAGRVEVQRTRVLLEADIEAANGQVNIVRADLEAEVNRARQETEHVRMGAEAMREKHELILKQEADAKREALREATEERSRVLYEQRKKHEQLLEELRKQHGRELDIAVEDKERSEAILNERLGLADSKIDHLQDKVLHLEEKLEVTKSAAHAAAQAAQSAKPAIAAPAPSSGPPEKVSPQALRETIMVLQEQLQEREGRIERLQQELSSHDADAPQKLRERETEVGWLRELLGVRVDDLSDLVNTLSQPHFDRDTVRDAAIRIRTNLQMEQHEKERLIHGGGNGGGGGGAQQTFPPGLASLSNFASPKAVQLAAALGNWRRGRDAAVGNLSQLSTSASAGASTSGSRRSSRAHTPSKPSPSPSPAAQGFFSGLMTPPTSTLRRTPQTAPLAGPSRRLAEELDRTPRQQQAGKLPLRPPARVPVTPPLLRQGSYDMDAEQGAYGPEGFEEGEGGSEEGVEGEERRLEPFGPGLHY